MGNFEMGIFYTLLYLPYVLTLISIILLCRGFYLKKHKKSGKRYLIFSIVCFIMGIIIFLIPVILLLIIKLSE